MRHLPIISIWVKDDLKLTQETVILHLDFPSEKAEKPVAIPFGASTIEGWTEDSKLNPLWETESPMVYRSGKPFSMTGGEVERVMGIEPTSQAWEARVLPLNYTRNGFYLM